MTWARAAVQGQGVRFTPVADTLGTLRMAHSDPLDPIDAFAELSRIKLHESDLGDVLDRVAALAKRTIPGSPKYRSP